MNTTTTTQLFAKNKITGEIHPVIYTSDQWGNPRRIVDGKTYIGNKQFDRTFTIVTGTKA